MARKGKTYKSRTQEHEKAEFYDDAPCHSFVDPHVYDLLSIEDTPGNIHLTRQQRRGFIPHIRRTARVDISLDPNPQTAKINLHIKLGGTIRNADFHKRVMGVTSVLMTLQQRIESAPKDKPLSNADIHQIIDSFRERATYIDAPVIQTRTTPSVKKDHKLAAKNNADTPENGEEDSTLEGHQALSVQQKKLLEEVNIEVEGRTHGQKALMNAMQTQDFVFCRGTAGTGKTFLAVAEALRLLKDGKIKRIIFSRPNVRDGKEPGAVPGSMEQKHLSVLRPLYQAFYEILGQGKDDDGKKLFQKLKDKSLVQFIPIEEFLGNDFKDSLMIIDEAQNATHRNMDTIITRVGTGGKLFCVGGDEDQIKLRSAQDSAFDPTIEALKDVEGFAVIELHAEDNQRHDLLPTLVQVRDDFYKAHNLGRFHPSKQPENTLTHPCLAESPRTPSHSPAWQKDPSPDKS